MRDFLEKYKTSFCDYKGVKNAWTRTMQFFQSSAVYKVVLCIHGIARQKFLLTFTRKTSMELRNPHRFKLHQQAR